MKPNRHPIIFTTVLALGFTCASVILVACEKKAADPSAPQNLRVPALAFDEKSIVLVWNKLEKYADIVDYTFTGQKVHRCSFWIPEIRSSRPAPTISLARFGNDN